MCPQGKQEPGGSHLTEQEAAEAAWKLYWRLRKEPIPTPPALQLISATLTPATAFEEGSAAVAHAVASIPGPAVHTTGTAAHGTASEQAVQAVQHDSCRAVQGQKRKATASDRTGWVIFWIVSRHSEKGTNKSLLKLNPYTFCTAIC